MKNKKEVSQLWKDLEEAEMKDIKERRESRKRMEKMMDELLKVVQS